MLFISIHKVLRNGISPKNFLIHATDNIQETKDNQRALEQPEEYKQRQFDTLRQVFDVLNFSGIPYVILRNFEKMPDEVNVDPNHLDVDILVNDYYALKRIVDGDSPQEFFWDHCENGFHRVVNYVLIDGKRISFDVRSIGDNYLDEKWQKDILERRVEFRSGIYVPSEEDHLYSLIYHAVIQKTKVSETFVKVFRDIANYTVEQAKDRVFLRAKLDAFLDKHGYSMIKPHDKSVGYFINADPKRSKS